MHQEENVELYRRTLKKWGEQAQFDQVIEECAELTTALLHYRRDKADASTVIDEMADVILMLGQLRWMFGVAEVECALKRKRAKLEDLLSQENAPSPRGVVE